MPSRLRVPLLAMALGIVAAVAGVVVPGPSIAPASALSGSQFNPGNIISDAYFFDRNAMSEAQIQSFLDSKSGGCLNSLCLGVLRVNTATEPASYSPGGELLCNAYTGATSERASTIIFKVQQACGISAKVLLVILQKEQSLVTRAAPTALSIERAMGYGCPDNTGGTCASQYYGFYNQVSNAAWQLRRYGAPPPFGNYQPGWEAIQFNPNIACGSSQVYITNRATAALYNYTPYQPNAAALGNLHGTGDGCSSYGNRNFWVYYNDWFGSPTQPPGTPEGNLTVTPKPGALELSGWAVDPDAVTGTVTLSVQLDSSWFAVYANVVGADRGGTYPGAGNRHDFLGSIPASVGNHVLCVYPLNVGGVGGTGTFGCQTVTVPGSPAPVGAITSATASGTTVSFAGWAVEPDRLAAATSVAVNIGSHWIGFTANQPDSVAPTKVPGAGPNHGFAGSFVTEPGVRTFCLWANRVHGPPVQLGCRTLLVPEPVASIAKLESVTANATGVDVVGYAIWPSSPSTSVSVALNIGSNWIPAVANQPSPSGAAAAPGSGANHGFAARVNLPPGTYNICVWVTQPASPAKMTGCKTATVTSTPTPSATLAEIQSVTGTASGVSVSGWAVWPSSPATAVPVAVNIGSSWHALTANQPNSAAAAAVPAAGANHGYSGSFPLGPGTHSICVWVANPGGGATNIGCQNASTVAGPAVVGAISDAAGAVGGIHVDGWAVLPADPATPVAIAVNVGSSWTAVPTGVPNCAMRRTPSRERGRTRATPASCPQHPVRIRSACGQRVRPGR